MRPAGITGTPVAGARVPRRRTSLIASLGFAGLRSVVLWLVRSSRLRFPCLRPVRLRTLRLLRHIRTASHRLGRFGRAGIPVAVLRLAGRTLLYLAVHALLRLGCGLTVIIIALILFNFLCLRTLPVAPVGTDITGTALRNCFSNRSRNEHGGDNECNKSFHNAPIYIDDTSRTSA